MRCEEWRKLLVDQLAGELTAEEAARLQRHFAECPACVEEEARLRLVMKAAAPPLPEAPDLSAMEARLLGEMRRLTEAPGATRAEPDDAGTVARAAGDEARAGATRSAAGRHVHARGFFPLLLRIPIPSYAVLLLVIGAVAGGFWLGRIQAGARPGDVEGTGGAAMNYPAADTSGAAFRSRVPGGEGSPRSASTHHRPASWAQFATAPGDGIALASTPPADTL